MAKIWAIKYLQTFNNVSLCLTISINWNCYILYLVLIWYGYKMDVMSMFAGLLETTVPSTSSIISLYSLSKDRNPCILLQADASITFTYKTKSGEDRVSLILCILTYSGLSFHHYVTVTNGAAGGKLTRKWDVCLRRYCKNITRWGHSVKSCHQNVPPIAMSCKQWITERVMGENGNKKWDSL